MKYNPYDDVARNMIKEFEDEGYACFIEDLTEELGREPTEEDIEARMERY